MPAIATSRNLSMDAAGLIGRGSGAGRSTIMDAAAVRTFTSTLTAAEVASLISSAVGNYLPLSGGTLTGDLRVNNGVIGRYRGPTNSGVFFYDTSFYLTDESGKTRLMSDVSSVKLASDEKFGFSSGVNADTSIDTPAVRDSPGCFAFRNATTAQKIKITKTWTSSTICEDLEIGFTGTNYDFVSRVGSAGGSNQPIRVGHIAADGTTFAGLTVATSGAITANGRVDLGSNILLLPFNGTAYSTYVANGTGLCVFGASGAAGYGFSVSGNTVTLTTGTRTEFALRRTFAPTSGTATFTQILMQPTINQTGGANGISRGLWINPDITAAADWRSLEVSVGKSVLQAVEATTITASGNLTYVPATSTITLGTNGQFAIEMTSNTAGNLVYRGSDGTTRRMALTFV